MEHNGDFPAATRELSRWLNPQPEPIELEDFVLEVEDASDAEDAAGTPITWPTPQPLPNGLRPVSSLSDTLLPESLRPWLADIAERLQVPLEFPAAPALVAVASLIGNSIRIRPRRRDDWTVTPNLWGAIVGRPGALKSPATEQVLKPLRRLIKEAETAHAEAVERWKFEKEASDIKRAATRDKMKRAAKTGSSLEEFRADLTNQEEAEPRERRYIVNDTTVEKYGELLNQNPRGLLIFRDELTGWLRSLDDERRANDRAFYLEAWNGDGSYAYDRIGRGTLKIDSTTTSIFGGIQPAPLESYLRSALGQGEGDDGLLQRFQVIVYPDLPADWRDVDRWPDTTAKNRAFDIFQKIDALKPEEIETEEEDGRHFLRFAEDAQELFSEWYGNLKRELHNGQFEHVALESHFAKYAGLMPSLALIFHLVDVVDSGVLGSVSLQATEKAVAWCKFLRAHAERLYGLRASGVAMHARTLVKRLQAGVFVNSFTARDLYRKEWAGMAEPKDAARVLELLVDLDYLKAATQQGKGRSTIAFEINPLIKAVKL